MPGKGRRTTGEVTPTLGAAGQLFDPTLHARVVRSFPVDAVALRALLKFLMQLGGAGRKQAADLLLQDGLQAAVARHATCEWTDGAHQIESPRDLGELTAAVGLPQPITVRDGALLE